MDDSIKVRCRIAQEETNRPEEISPDRKRIGFSVYESSIREKWPCEYRFTPKEIELMQAGKHKEIYVTKEDAVRVLEKVTEDMKIGSKCGY
jgi:hypothetical protein